MYGASNDDRPQRLIHVVGVVGNIKQVWHAVVVVTDGGTSLLRVLVALLFQGNPNSDGEKSD